MVEMLNDAGETISGWLDEETINFIDPAFLAKERTASVHPVAALPPVAADGLPFCDGATSSVPELQPVSPSEPVDEEQPRTTNKGLECEVCGRNFKRRDHLKSHLIKVHSNSEVNVCPICSNEFKYASNWTVFMTT